MKTSELRNLIREEVRKVLKEATMVKQGPGKFGAKKEAQVGDFIYWPTYDGDERGMGRTRRGIAVAKITKILGSANVMAETLEDGDQYKVAKNELIRIPKKGEFITASGTYTAQQTGGWQQSSYDISGVVLDVKMSEDAGSIKIKMEDGKSGELKLEKLYKITAYAGK